MQAGHDEYQVGFAAQELRTDAAAGVRRRFHPVKVDAVVNDMNLLRKGALHLDQVRRGVVRHRDHRVALGCTEAIKADVPALVDARVVVRVVPGHHPRGSAREATRGQPDDGRLEEMDVEDVDLLAAQEA